MPRPKFCRKINCLPGNNYYKPRGIPLSELEEIVLNIDEFEAIRLGDYEGLYQEQAASQMNISRQTFGRIIESAHKKIAEALIMGKAIKIEGGNYEIRKALNFECPDCKHLWNIPFISKQPDGCPKCKGRNIHQADSSTDNTDSSGTSINENKNTESDNSCSRTHGNENKEFSQGRHGQCCKRKHKK